MIPSRHINIIGCDSVHSLLAYIEPRTIHSKWVPFGEYFINHLPRIAHGRADHSLFLLSLLSSSSSLYLDASSKNTLRLEGNKAVMICLVAERLAESIPRLGSPDYTVQILKGFFSAKLYEGITLCPVRAPASPSEVLHCFPLFCG